jgi:hypothetical protein
LSDQPAQCGETGVDSQALSECGHVIRASARAKKDRLEPSEVFLAPRRRLLRCRAALRDSGAVPTLKLGG